MSLLAKSAEGGVAALTRLASVPIILLAISGCAATTNWLKEPLPVSVSAANYSQLSGKELYARVNDADNTQPEASAATKPTKPLFYLLLPGEIYPSDVSLETIYRELEVSLEPRGYFNVIYQMRAGRMPTRIDYLLRVHYGQRLLLRPRVRGDRVTWGNDGLVSSRYKTNLLSDLSYDPRIGLSPEEMAGIHSLFASLMAGNGVGALTVGGVENYALASSLQLSEPSLNDFGQEDQASRDFCLVVVEAFKFDDVRVMNGKAPCTWATFIAVPVEHGQKFSDVLRTMLHTATPYFGETTRGLQIYEVPPGKVLMGTPVEVPEPLKASLP